jgi:choline-glycine betaine transporter
MQRIFRLVMIVISIILALIFAIVFVSDRRDPVAAQIRHQANDAWSHYGYILVLVFIFGWIAYFVYARFSARKS